MKIYADNLTIEHVRAAAVAAGVGFQNTWTRDGWFVPIHEFEPRKRNGLTGRPYKRGFTVYLTGSSPYASAHDNSEKAATWDETGVFIARLLHVECTAEIAGYKGNAEFFKQTREWSDRNRQYGRRKDMTAPWLRRG